MNLEKFIDNIPTVEECLDLFNLNGTEVFNLLSIANKVREKYCGNDLQVTSLTNAKSGNCSENCSFCAQSSYYSTDITKYDLKDESILIEEFDNAIKRNGADTFCLVTATKSMVKTSKDFKKILNIAKALKKRNNNIKLCASLGMSTNAELDMLKESGIDIYNINLQTAPSAYASKIATTHKIEDRIKTLNEAKKSGLKICTGGIIGLGETVEQIIELGFILKEIGADIIPVNILIPIKKTKYENQEEKSINEILKTIAIFRLINKKARIKIGAGRESRMKDFMGLAFMAGANALISGGYLTKAGRNAADDVKFVADIKKLWDEK